MISNATARSTANVFSAPLSGINRGMRQFEEAGENIAQGDLSPQNVGSEIEAAEFVKANGVSLRTADEMVGTLLNTVA